MFECVNVGMCEEFTMISMEKLKQIMYGVTDFALARRKNLLRRAYYNVVVGILAFAGLSVAGMEKIELNGIWDFRFEQNRSLESLVLPDFQPNDKLIVPGAWDAMSHYYNQRGTGLYRRFFTLEKDVVNAFLVVDGACLRSKYWLDGREIGFSKLPARFSEKLNNETKFSYTAYNFPALLDACEKIARQVVVKEGGRVEKDAQGAEWFVIPVQKPTPNVLELSWAPGPSGDARFTAAELAKIELRERNLPPPETFADPDPTKAVQKTLDRFFKGWKTSTNATDEKPGFRAGLKRVDGGTESPCVMTHPAARGSHATLSRTLVVPAKNARLHFRVANEPQIGDFLLRVRVAGEEVFSTVVSGGDKKSKTFLFRDFDVPLTRWAGRNVTIELVNEANGWSWEQAYWSKLEVLGE